MNTIPCDVCLDLMPLVQDDAASEASRVLVLQHLEECSRCRAIYEGTAGSALPTLNERRIAWRLKWEMRGWAAGLLLAGTVLCLAMLNGREYGEMVILLLPFLGGIVCLCWKNVWKTGLLKLDLLLAGIGGVVGYISAMDGWRLHRALQSFCVQFLLCGLLLLLGAAIASLLRFAFCRRKEE